MSQSRNSRREFLHQMACLACSGSAAALIPQLRMMGTAMAATSSLSGYKALVCLYLQGGNDSWNLLVPWDTARFNTYAAARNGVYVPGSNSNGLALAQPASGNAQIVTDHNDGNGATNQYFLHPNLTNLASLYKSNQLAFVVNVGSLKVPINMADYKAGTSVPPQLFSHADQTGQWHQANTSTTTALGWGGLCADDLQTLGGANCTSNPQLSLCISIAGANRFEIGNIVNNPYQLSSGGLTNLSGMCNPCSGGASNTSRRDSALNDLLAATYPSNFAAEYGNVFGDARALFATLKPNLNSGAYAVPTSPNTTAFPNTTLGNQLRMVAAMIKLSKAQNYATRQIYFVQLGGFDLHSGFMSSQDTINPPGNGSDHAGLLYQVDQALAAFWAEMSAGQAIANDVTVFTMTEFARTLQSNGSGADHAWGGVHFALGGAVNGGKLYTQGMGGTNGKGIDGAFPNQSYGTLTNPNPNAFSRGQFIPGLSVEQYAATFAKWMDVTPSGLAAAFPNLGSFPGGTLGLLPTA